MISELSTYISDLLYSHDAVIVPNFGGFVRTYKSSAIDHVQGLIYAPSKQINFNENLVVNDGILINYVRKKLNLPAKEARQMVERFVSEIQVAVEKREIVVFPDVGRLYMDYEQNIQFLPDTSNFSTESYGLPTLQYYPILRNREAIGDEAPEPTTSITISDKNYQNEQRKRKWSALLRPAVPYLIAGAVFFTAFGLYKGMDRANNLNIDMPPTLPVNFNKKPTAEIIVDVPKRDEDELDYESDYDSGKEEMNSNESKSHGENKSSSIDRSHNKELDLEKETKNNYTAPIDTEGATLGPSQKEGVIIVHAFGNKDNVRKMISKLIELGYSPYTDKTKKLTRVGIQFIYEDKNEIQSLLKDIRTSVSKRAYIKK